MFWYNSISNSLQRWLHLIPPPSLSQHWVLEAVRSRGKYSQSRAPLRVYRFSILLTYFSDIPIGDGATFDDEKYQREGYCDKITRVSSFRLEGSEKLSTVWFSDPLYPGGCCIAIRFGAAEKPVLVESAFPAATTNGHTVSLRVQLQKTQHFGGSINST